MGKYTHISRKSLNLRNYNKVLMTSNNTNALKKWAIDIAVKVITAALVL